MTAHGNKCTNTPLYAETVCTSADHVNFGVYATYSARHCIFTMFDPDNTRKDERNVRDTLASPWHPYGGWLREKYWIRLPNCCCDSRLEEWLHLSHQAKSTWKNCDHWNWELTAPVYQWKAASFQDPGWRLKPPNQVGQSILWLGNIVGPRKTRGSMALGTMISIWKEKLFYSCGATCLKDTLNWRVGWGGEIILFINFSKSALKTWQDQEEVP